MTKAVINSYVLFSKLEQGREGHLQTLQEQLGNISFVEAVFPKYEKVPFIKQLVAQSKKRTGKALLESEIGCLLGHRKIWHLIANKIDCENEHFLILESDSKIVALDSLINAFAQKVSSNNKAQYDLFFWGAWNGNMRIKKSTQIQWSNKYSIGEPLIKSVYGTYGYSITPKAAKLLLKRTAKINYPVDYFKYHLSNTLLHIGAIRPAVIDTWKTTASNIVYENKGILIKRWLIMQIFDFRNMIIAYFC